MTASRNNRVITAAVAAVACAALTLAGCSAGHATQTGSQVAAVSGASITVGTLALRDLMIAYEGPEGYLAGEDAPLVVRIFNEGASPVTLTGATSDAAESVTLVGAPGPVVSPLPTASQSPSPSPAGSPSPGESPSSDVSPSPGAGPSASPTPSPTPEPAPAPAALSVQIPAQSYVLLVPGEGSYLQLSRIRGAIAPGTSAMVTFAFDNGVSIPIRIPMAPPSTSVPRGTPVLPPGEEGHD